MRTVLVLAAACAACAGCGGGRPQVVAAFYPLAWAATAVAPRDQVLNLTPTGAEPHDIELSPRQVGDVQRARVVLYLSHDFQPAVQEAVRGAQGVTVDLAGPGTDPHVWLDPVRFARIVQRVGAVLGARRRASVVAARVRALDGAYRRGLAHCARRSFVTTHAAFGYLARRYGLTQVAITGRDPEAEASPRDLARLVHRVQREHIRTVFFEPLASKSLAATLARNAGAHVAILDPVEGLTASEQKSGATYLTLMRQNLRALREALGCR